MSEERDNIFIAIDLKSFYASVECVERGLDPLEAHLVVADAERTPATICLAVSPALKAYGISGRARLFEVMEACEQKGLKFIIATPRMAVYQSYSTKIFQIYLKFVSSEDIIPYSIDEVFMDASAYPGVTWDTAKNFAMNMIKAIYEETGITATCGIGTNLFLAKVAMDIEAKHAQPDENGVRIAALDEMSFREKMWDHEPITDFWNVGPGIARRLCHYGLHTMGDICEYSLSHEELLYREFGKNAEILIDHAWGYESVGIKDIQHSRPKKNSISSGQVLFRAYNSDEARIVLSEMADSLVLDLVDKELVTKQVVLDVLCEQAGNIHGSINLERCSSSTKAITDAALTLYDRIIQKDSRVRKICICFTDTRPKDGQYEQMSLFEDRDADIKEQKMQKAILEIKKKYGKNALLKGTNFEPSATMRDRNQQIGGHKA